jgi:YidC/Oxa1 family membrane protein insertase
MNENRNLVLAMVLSLAVYLGWTYFVSGPQMKAEQAKRAHAAEVAKVQSGAAAPGAPQAAAQVAHLSLADALKRGGQRIAIQTPSVDGTLLLKGARLDDLRLKNYRETVDKKSPEIVLFSPEGTAYPYYVQFGFVGQDKKLVVPTSTTPWKQAGSGILTPSTPVTLTWDNSHGIVFTRLIKVDDKFMFTVIDSVTNKSGAKATLYPYAYVVRDGATQSALNAGYMTTLHEGFVGYADGLKDPTYSKFKDDDAPPQTFSATGGWLGITDKYWMAAIIPPQNESFDGAFRAFPFQGATKSYQADYRLGARTINPNASLNVTQRLFAGAKVYDVIHAYQEQAGVTQFVFAIDWGWFRPITQPIFWLLDHLYRLIGNFGLAILALTVIIKTIFFPIANAQYKSMGKMKKVQPEMEKLKQRFADDPQKQQAALMELYKREKVNPVAGCLPMILIIPVFFSLYKTINVTIEARHAPFYGWIHDLSAPDPTSILNLFGLLPFDPHAVLPSALGFLSVGIWPILMGCTQWLQTKMNPAPADPVQAKMFAFMPLIFTFMFVNFPAGLVIYYTWNNLLSVAQQYVMMRRQGVEVHLFENLKFKNLLGGGTKALPAPKE